MKASNEFLLYNLPLDVYYDLYLCVRKEEKLPQLDNPCPFGWITGGLSWIWDQLFAAIAPEESFTERSKRWLQQIKERCAKRSFDAMKMEIMDCLTRAQPAQYAQHLSWIIDFLQGNSLYSFKVCIQGYTSYTRLRHDYLSPFSRESSEIKKELEKYCSKTPGLLPVASKELKVIFQNGEIFALEPNELKAFILNRNFMENLTKLLDNPEVNKRLKRLLVAIYRESLSEQEKKEFLRLKIPHRFGISNILDDKSSNLSVPELIREAINHDYMNIPVDFPFFVDVEDLPDDPDLVVLCAEKVPEELEKLARKCTNKRSVELWDCFHFRRAWLFGVTHFTALCCKVFGMKANNSHCYNM